MTVSSSLPQLNIARISYHQSFHRAASKKWRPWPARPERKMSSPAPSQSKAPETGSSPRTELGPSQNGEYVAPISLKPQTPCCIPIPDLTLGAHIRHDNSYPGKMAGLGGRLAGGQDGIFFTLRYDWSETHGFHVNAMRGKERRLYKSDHQNKAELEAVQRYDTLTEKIARLGDQSAAGWLARSPGGTGWTHEAGFLTRPLLMS